MHFEKKIAGRVLDKSTKISIPFCLVFLLIVLDLMYIFVPDKYLSGMIPKDFWTFKFLDIINAVAQIATAGAFIFAVYQYSKSKESERQSVLVKECRDLVGEMVALSDSFRSLPAAGVSEVARFIEKMYSLGSSFDEIFRALKEDTHKTIVRMRWQEMYFSEMRQAMEVWNTRNILHSMGVDPNLYNHLRLVALYSRTNDESPGLFEEYDLLKAVVEDEAVSSVIRDCKFVTHEWLFFQQRFFDNDALNDHLYGYFNIIEVRVRAPLLSIVNELCNAQLAESMNHHGTALS